MKRKLQKLNIMGKPITFAVPHANGHLRVIQNNLQKKEDKISNFILREKQKGGKE